MPRYVAFLRAINVGGRNVKMEALRKIFEADGFKNVSTFIASGNVLFDSKAKPALLEREIEALLQKELGYRVDTFIRSIEELASLAKANPFPDEEGHTIHVGFTGDPIDKEVLGKLKDFPGEVDSFHAEGPDLYWCCRIRSSDSKFSSAMLEKILKRSATLRNIKTVRKLAESGVGAPAGLLVRTVRPTLFAPPGNTKDWATWCREKSNSWRDSSAGAIYRQDQPIVHVDIQRRAFGRILGNQRAVRREFLSRLLRSQPGDAGFHFGLQDSRLAPDGKADGCHLFQQQLVESIGHDAIVIQDP